MSRSAYAVALALAVALSACSSSSHSSSSSTTTTTSSGSVAGSGTASAGLPAVQNATNISAQPVIEATSAPAPTKLEVKDLVVGTGQTAQATSTVKVNYVGALYPSGKVFDASAQHGGAISFALNQVIPGFEQGIVGMKVGGRRELVIPPALGYGSQANGPIPANSTLTFVIDLVGVS